PEHTANGGMACSASHRLERSRPATIPEYPPDDVSLLAGVVRSMRRTETPPLTISGGCDLRPPITSSISGSTDESTSDHRRSGDDPGRGIRLHHHSAGARPFYDDPNCIRVCA